MSPERWRQVEQLYHAALELAPQDRSIFLAEACAGEDALRREVESLLAFDEPSSSFIETPPDDIAAELLAGGPARSMLGITLGHYKLQSLIGAGGMGEVYRAYDMRLRREVAIKILPEHLASNAEALHRFEREARVVAALSHPNILAIYDFGTEAGVSYAVTELLEGETLRERLKRSQLDWRTASRVGIAIAEGLAAAHAKGVIHRDLKPENLFLTSSGGVKVLDFGIARVKHAVTADSETLTSPDTTRPGTIMGTIGYMSPEQVRGEEADPPSDLFSLGSVLYEMVSGQRPFARATAAEMIAAILDAEPPVQTGAGKKIPAEMERVIHHCLAKPVPERYQSAHDLASDLSAILSESGQALYAPRSKRRRVRLAVPVALAVIVLSVIALSLYPFDIREQAIDSLAILPMVNASGDANLEYLSDGITERLINSMSQLSQLKRVIARSSVESYKNKTVEPRKVGQELNVRAVLTGKMNQRGDGLTIEAELVNTSNGAWLWGERYNRKLSDLLAVQEEIARHISESLRLKLSSREQQRLAKRQTTSIEAHQLYFKGRYYMGKYTEEGLNEALKYFKQAIDLDPNFALAYAGMADTYVFLADEYLLGNEAFPRARAAALKALEQDEMLAEAHSALATVKFTYDWEWTEAERSYKRALELNPGYASAHNLYGILLIIVGRFAEAQVEMDRAQELDPLSSYVHVGTVGPVFFAGQYDQAIAQLHRVIALNPDFSNAYLRMGSAYALKGRSEEAIAALRQARALNKSWATIAALGYACAKAGQREKAQQALDELQELAKRGQGSEYGFAIVYAGLGEKDQALATLERAYRMRDGNLSAVKVEPFFDSLRSEPRFTDLLQRMNLATK